MSSGGRKAQSGGRPAAVLADPPGSHQPVVLLLVEVLGPLARQLQIVVGLVGLVVQVQAGRALLGDGPLYLRALVPLVEGRNGHDFWPDGQGRLQGRLIVASVHPVPGVVVVPRPDGCIHVAGADAGDEEQVVGVAEGPDCFPVLVRGAEGEAVGGKVGVDAIKAARSDVVFVALLHDEGDENAVVRGPPDAVSAFGCQQLRPGLWRRQVGVVDVKQRQNLTRAGPESVEGAVVSVPGKSQTFTGLFTHYWPVWVTKTAV